MFTILLDFQMSLYNFSFSCSGHFFHMCDSFFLGEPSPPRSTPWGAYRSAISYKAVPLSFDLSMQHSFTHSLTADRSMVVGHVLTVHTCSFVCTSHRNDSTHPSLFMSLGALWESYVCSYDISHNRTQQVSITSFTATSVSQMVTHPSTNWTHSCLTSVIGLQVVAPCQLLGWVTIWTGAVAELV